MCRGQIREESEARMIPRFLPEANWSGGHLLNWGYQSKTVFWGGVIEQFYYKILMSKHTRNHTLYNYLYLRGTTLG